MTKEEQRAYNIAYAAKNKDKIAAQRKKYRENNRELIQKQRQEHREANKDTLRDCSKRRSKIYRESEGLGVYVATYPSGVYIGSGWIHDRRKGHTTGNSRIAKTLNEKATSFEVICLTDTKEESMIKESEVIKQHGLGNLLNTKH